MRIVLVHPNYRSGGAEIAGSWPPAWVAYMAGPLKAIGYDDIHFIDAMTNDIGEADSRATGRVEARCGEMAAITSSIRAERHFDIAGDQ